MCIVIDANTFHLVFNSRSPQNINFRPVLDWIAYGNGKIVYGGTKYKKELLCARTYFSYFIELDRAGKVIKLSDSAVDNIQKSLDKLIPQCNDTHLLAIIINSKCKLLCTCEREAIEYIKNQDIYPTGVRPPKIYSQYRNRHLLNDKNIAEICKPCAKGTKLLRLAIGLKK